MHVKYAKAKEKQGQFKEAADAYEKGNDTGSLVRLCLTELQVPRKSRTCRKRALVKSSTMSRAAAGAWAIVPCITRIGPCSTYTRAV